MKNMKFKKVIIWGHKFSHYNTFTHIHSSYTKAFKHLGYDTYWMDKADAQHIPDFDYENSLFFTEGQVDSNIPLIKTATYVLHHCKTDKYLNAGSKILNLCNYVKYCEEGISFNYKDTGNTVKKISDFFFYDEKAMAIYQPWATDLVPEEIEQTDPCLFDSSKKVVNYVGSIWSENYRQLLPFAEACKNNNIEFRNYAGGISDNDNKKLIRESYIAPDIRGDWHVECGYIPCRLFKNMSYGQVSGINSPHVYKLFGDMIAYSPNTYDLFEECVKVAKRKTASDIQDSMNYIKEKHTYITRVNNLLYILDNY